MTPAETRDRVLLRSILAPNPGESLYLLSDLSEPFFSQCRWFTAPGGVIVWFSGLADPSLQSAGAAEAVSRALASAAPALPAAAWLKVPVAHVEVWRRHYDLEDEETLVSMLLPREIHVDPLDATLESSDENLEELLDVYADYPENFFEPSGMKDNVYAVVRAGGRVVSVAGTHTFSPEEGVAAIGNVVTRRDSRGRGYAQRAVACAVEELRRRGCATIGLHVAEANHAAVRCYQRMGFTVAARLTQAWARRRE